MPASRVRVHAAQAAQGPFTHGATDGIGTLPGRTGRIRPVGRIGRTGRIKPVGRIGRVGRVGRTWRVGRTGRIHRIAGGPGVLLFSRPLLYAHARIPVKEAEQRNERHEEYDRPPWYAEQHPYRFHSGFEQQSVKEDGTEDDQQSDPDDAYDLRPGRVALEKPRYTRRAVFSRHGYVPSANGLIRICFPPLTGVDAHVYIKTNQAGRDGAGRGFT